MDLYDPSAWEKGFNLYHYRREEEIHALIPKKLLYTLVIKSWGNRIKFDKLADWIEKKIPGDE